MLRAIIEAPKLPPLPPGTYLFLNNYSITTLLKDQNTSFTTGQQWIFVNYQHNDFQSVKFFLGFKGTFEGLGPELFAGMT